MANLVSPGYEPSALINRILAPNVERNIEFKGLNRRDYFEEGEMVDMLNLSSDRYPYLAPRRLRGVEAVPSDMKRPIDLISRNEKSALLYMDEDDAVKFYYDGQVIPAVTGLTVSTRMVAINTKICFFPEQKYLVIPTDGSTPTEYGDLGASFSGTGQVSVSDNAFIRYSYVTSAPFKADDAVNLTGTISYTDGGGTTHTNEALDVSFVIERISVQNNLMYIGLPAETFIEAIGEGATGITVNGTIARKVPKDLSCVIEWNNRLWGVSDEENTVYACKLGDPTNWQYFQGTSLDSYYAQQGTDGTWTGAAVYSSHLIFFKESSMCRIYGSTPSSFQITNTNCFGVEQGSSKSIVTINDKIFYKSAIGIMAYQGGTPYLISDKFNFEFRNVVAGTEGLKYYASVQKKGGGVDLMVLDVDRAVWHKEDHTWFRACATNDNRLYYIHMGTETQYCGLTNLCSDWKIIGEDSAPGIGIINPVNPSEDYESLEWMAEFGAFDEFVEERKIYSKLALRFKNEGACHVRVYISINEGDWELVREYESPKTGGEVIPIIPRRCDRYSIKIEGTGNVELKSLTRRYRQGTHGKL